MARDIVASFAVIAADTFTAGKANDSQAAAGTEGVPLTGEFNISISGDWVGTVTLQRSFDGVGTGYLDVKTYASGDGKEIQELGTEPEGNVFYRIGVKAAELSSGTANVRISQ